MLEPSKHKQLKKIDFVSNDKIHYHCHWQGEHVKHYL